MRIRTLGFSVIVLASVAGTRSISLAAENSKAMEVLAAARKAIGDKKLDALKTFSVEASVQRNVNTMQLTSDVEIVAELPDKYLRSDQSSGAVGGGFTMGFSGDSAIRPAHSGPVAGGGMIIRMGPGGPLSNEKLSPEEQARVDQQMVRSQRAEISRLMLGWFATAHPSLNAQYAYVGEAESPDGKAHVIDVTNADGFAARLFVDQQTNLPLMVSYRGPQPRMITAGGPRPAGAAGARSRGEMRDLTEEERKKIQEEAEKQMKGLQNHTPTLVEFTLFFEDWRDVGGVQFPHKVRRASEGTTNEEWTIHKVKINPEFDQGKFQG